ncbi:MAG: hypothetical protein AB7O37_15350 [Vicinamibacteria bacterium]
MARCRATVVLFLALAAAACAKRAFVAGFPPGLPELAGWERSSGSAAFEDPRRRVDYELYVAPARPGAYSVTRYRVRYADPGVQAASGITPSEKVQWDRDGRDVRRFECIASPPQRDGCAWQELFRGSLAFDKETPALLQIYALHVFLLNRREAEAAR